MSEMSRTEFHWVYSDFRSDVVDVQTLIEIREWLSKVIWRTLPADQHLQEFQWRLIRDKPETILKIDRGGGATKVDNWAAAAMMILAASPLARLFRKAPEGSFKLGMGTLSISAALTQKLIRNQFCKVDARWMRWSERGGIGFWLVKAVKLFKKSGCPSLQLSI